MKKETKIITKDSQIKDLEQIGFFDWPMGTLFNL